MAFPSVFSTFNRPATTDRLNNPSHSALHNTVSSALGQIEAIIGVTGNSSVQGTLNSAIFSPGSDGGGHVQGVNKGGTGQTAYTKGDILIAQSNSVLTRLAVGGDTLSLVADSTQAVGVKWASGGKFGGTGSDGALALSSGTTTVNIGSVAVLTKNYTSISITGTGRLAFTSPNTNGTTIVLKSQGNVTLTSTAPCIAASAMGSAGGGATSPGNDAYSFSVIKTVKGGAPTAFNQPGAGGSIASLAPATIVPNIYAGKYSFIVPGAGGGGGGKAGGGAGGSAINLGNGGSSGGNAADSGSGVGGAGGGALIIECGGALNFTTANGITVEGEAGGAGTGANGGGGGGGGGGICVVLYNSSVATTGTIVVTGGAGGSGSGTGGAGGAGLAGYSILGANTDIS